MTPTETVAAMLRAYPTLYKTRFDALYRLLTASGAKWDENGTISDEDAIVRQGVSPFYDEDAASSASYNAASAINARLETRRRNAEIRFTIDNADLIAQDVQGGFSEVILRGDMKDMLELPENVDPEWKAALIQLCEEIVYWEYPVGYMSHMTGASYSIGEKYAEDLKRAKAQAKAFLIRTKGGEAEKAALVRETLAADLEKLRQRAAAHGLTIDDLR